MPRARSLKPGFFKNEELAALGPYAMLLYAGLWILADREGRLEDRPKRIKAEVFPYFNQSVEKLLESLNESGFIRRYNSDENSFISIPTWKKHQNPHVKEAASTIPAPGKNSARSGKSGASPSDSGLRTPDTLTPDCGSTAPPPLTAEEFAKPDPTELAAKLIAELMPNHWVPSNPVYARMALEKILASAVNLNMQIQAIRRTHASHAEYHRRNAGAKIRRPQLQHWFSDEDYLHRAPKISAVNETAGDKLLRESREPD